MNKNNSFRIDKWNSWLQGKNQDELYEIYKKNKSTSVSLKDFKERINHRYFNPLYSDIDRFIFNSLRLNENNYFEYDENKPVPNENKEEPIFNVDGIIDGIKAISKFIIFMIGLVLVLGIFGIIVYLIFAFPLYSIIILLILILLKISR